MTPTRPPKPLIANAKVAQPKIAGGTPAARQTPAAPPVYRPQPAPKVLQPKLAATIQLLCKHGYQSKRSCPHCRKSQQDRNVNKFVSYQTPNKKTINNDVKKVKELNTNLAHGSRNSNYGQSGKTQKLLDDINENNRNNNNNNRRRRRGGKRR
jgi:hypothetical protein